MGAWSVLYMGEQDHGSELSCFPQVSMLLQRDHQRLTIVHVDHNGPGPTSYGRHVVLSTNGRISLHRIEHDGQRTCTTKVLVLDRPLRPEKALERFLGAIESREGQR